MSVIATLRRWWAALRRRFWRAPAISTTERPALPAQDSEPEPVHPWREPMQPDGTPGRIFALDQLVLFEGVEFGRHVVRQGAELMNGKRAWNDGPVHRASRSLGFVPHWKQTVPDTLEVTEWAPLLTIEELRRCDGWRWALVALDADRAHLATLVFSELPGRALVRVLGPTGPHRSRRNELVLGWQHLEPVIRDALIALGARACCLVLEGERLPFPARSRELDDFVASAIAALPAQLRCTHTVWAARRALAVQ